MSALREHPEPLPQIVDRPVPHTTQAAEGLLRRRFTVADVEAMVAAGIMDPKERVELIGGELVPMSAKGIRHERLKTFINMELARKLPEPLAFTPETTFRLSEDTFVEPDFVVYENPAALDGLNGPSSLLAIEVGDSSLAYDRGRKASIYAAFGVRELWVIDAVKLETRVFLEPMPLGYRRVADFRTEATLTPIAVPALAIALSDYR